jgi:hypothetical protein
MKASSISIAAFVMSFALLSIPAHGEQLGATDVRRLELGDIYVVAVRCDGAEARYNGQLVQMTDQWLVLREWSERWGERRVPKVIRVPFATRQFHDVEFDWIVIDRWIPRAAATVAGRCIREDKKRFSATHRHSATMGRGNPV